MAPLRWTLAALWLVSCHHGTGLALPDAGGPLDAADRPLDVGADAAPDLAGDASEDSGTDLGADRMRDPEVTLFIYPSRQKFTGIAGAPGIPIAFLVGGLGDLPPGMLTLTLGGANGDEFEVASSTCTAPPAVGRSCLVAIAFKPRSAGMKQATLTVTGSPGGMAVASLEGVALSP